MIAAKAGRTTRGMTEGSASAMGKMYRLGKAVAVMTWPPDGQPSKGREGALCWQ